ncbi:hypothetical protein ML401_06830 [Bradyrhizobium sp. 62B]|nr:hypothetical protein ML401_06830 [Bradyrhizobium sp. 62B]
MNKLTSKSRVVFGLGAQAYSQFVTIALQFTTVPALIYAWGLQRYGAWIVVSALSSYLTLADLGFAQVAANEMTIRMARRDNSGANEVFQSTLLMVSFISTVILVLYASFVLFAPITQIFQFGDIPASELRIAMIILSVQIISSIFFGVVAAGLRSIGLFSVMIGISSTARLLEGIAVIAVALSGYNFVAAAAAVAIIRVITTVATAVMVTKRAHWLSLRFKEASLLLIRNMLTPSITFMAYTLGNLINIQGMTVVAGAMFGPAAVASFTAMRTLARIGITGSNMVSHTLQPEYSTLGGAGKFENFRRLFISHSLFNTATAAGMYFLLTEVGDRFLVYWTHGTIAAIEPLFALLVLSGSIEMIWSTLQTPLVSTSKHIRTATSFLLISICGLAFLRLDAFGQTLAALGWVNLSTALIMVVVVGYELRRNKLGLR